MHGLARLTDVWVYLAASPLLGLTTTLVAYLVALWLYRRLGFNPLANPVLIAIAIVVSILAITHTPYQTYFEGAQFVHFMLGPATVALAMPLYKQWHNFRRAALPLMLGLAAGSITAVVSAVGIAYAMGASRTIVVSLAPKSATTPIAMAISERFGGLPSLTAVLVICTGILGAVLARYVLNVLRIDSHPVRGFALGVASHGIGTARALQVSAEMGAFAGLGMGLNGVFTAVMVPLALPWFLRWIGS
ncbi:MULTISPECIES: LrgB family protein [Herbaspirillum]|jgi:predicted murein hydrolase (TIGR00659 family)|uniref:LrgB family protein n=2 Tax=Herbaspirillum rubrisubalbicans TaxID=80842 RepID=A0AAD0U894_9BURK|nr:MULTISPECIES: LrgB family protein [Herbaspirillum]ALU90092.1 effector of murein hydrolase protein [Herbaspirillum rubrisubalbicans M1]AYR25127.1 LrgB family protein [Herbaspirillum rubrisubalbicans]MCP1573242.1 putative murein hydrolase (TIGR00659 family) [Herbaspirillum rubrisubalbicans]NQE47558.1 membrane protein [Herbaspirillum rubrisubalbicans]QJQ01758.1 LrgB family protein [Herbaspirillum rubrisubalbicans Os34]